MSHLYHHIEYFGYTIVQWTEESANNIIRISFGHLRQDAAKIDEWLSRNAFWTTLCSTKHVAKMQRQLSHVLASFRVATLTCIPRLQVFIFMIWLLQQNKKLFLSRCELFWMCKIKNLFFARIELLNIDFYITNLIIVFQIALTYSNNLVF